MMTYLDEKGNEITLEEYERKIEVAKEESISLIDAEKKELEAKKASILKKIGLTKSEIETLLS